MEPCVQIKYRCAVLFICVCCIEIVVQFGWMSEKNVQNPGKCSVHRVGTNNVAHCGFDVSENIARPDRQRKFRRLLGVN